MSEPTPVVFRTSGSVNWIHLTCVTHVFVRQSLFESEVPLCQCFLTAIFISSLPLNSRPIRRVYGCLILFAPFYGMSVLKQRSVGKMLLAGTDMPPCETARSATALCLSFCNHLVVNLFLSLFEHVEAENVLNVLLKERKKFSGAPHSFWVRSTGIQNEKWIFKPFL